MYGDLGDHNPLSLKSYKIGSLMLIFKKRKMTFLQGEFQPFCMLFILEDITQYCFITQVQIGKNFWPKFLWSLWSNGQRVRKGRKAFRVQIPEDLQGFSFSENQHRGPYFVGFQTKWIMITQVTIHNAVIIFSMFLASSLDSHWPYCDQ